MTMKTKQEAGRVKDPKGGSMTKMHAALCIAGLTAILVVVAAPWAMAEEASTDGVKRVEYGQTSAPPAAGSIAAVDAQWPSPQSAAPAPRSTAPERTLPVITRPAQPMRPHVSAAPPSAPAPRMAGPEQAIRRVQELSAPQAPAATPQPAASTPREMTSPTTTSQNHPQQATSPQNASAPAAAMNLQSPQLATPALSSITSEPIAPPQFDPAAPAPQAVAPVEAAAPVEPAVGPQNGDQAANEQTPAEQFVSRRELLGKPKTTVVPTVAEPSEEVRGAAAGVTAGGFFKLAAGALFLASLGLIGYRHKQKARSDEDDIIGSWLPPRKDLTSGYAAAFSGYSGGRSAGGRYATGRDRIMEMESDLIWKQAESSRRRDADELGAADPGFHDEVERKIRRRSAERVTDDAAIETSARPRRRVEIKDGDRDAIIDFAAKGLPLREIAKRLTLPPSEIRSVLAVSARGGRVRSAGSIPIEIQ